MDEETPTFLLSPCKRKRRHLATATAYQEAQVLLKRPSTGQGLCTRFYDHCNLAVRCHGVSGKSFALEWVMLVLQPIG